MCSVLYSTNLKRHSVFLLRLDHPVVRLESVHGLEEMECCNLVSWAESRYLEDGGDSADVRVDLCVR